MQKTYAFKNTIDDLNISSSGGAFLAIAKAFYRMHPSGIVYGSAFDEDFVVKHISASSYEDCKKFCGSKYVYSAIGNCYREIGRYLQEEKTVLFTGVPCQVGGLLKYLESKGINSSNLLTLDIVCHGTPKEDFWREYVEHLEKKEHAKLTYFSFRYKPLGWKGYPIYAEFANGVTRRNTIEISSYQNIYRKNLLTKKGCFSCPYPGAFLSDFTICDFWGVEYICPSLDTKNGVSLIISRTKKSDVMVDEIKRFKGITVEEFHDENYVKYNHNLTKKTEKPENYDMFWREYKDKGLDFILKKYGGESLAGRIKFYSKRFFRDMGMVDFLKRILRKA